eukprot:scpid36589/ scgid25733/ NAD kinase; Poly(P)/ATP NAD kinase
MDSPADKRKQFASQPKGRRTSSAPAPAARFGRSAAGTNAQGSPPSRSDGGPTRKSSGSFREFLVDASGETRLLWYNTPTNVLVIKKYRDRSVTAKFKDVTRFLVEDKGMSVMVENAVLSEKDVHNDNQFSNVLSQLHSFSCDDPDCDDKMAEIDFIVCLGGDGTLLYVSSLFQESVPPILAFRLGSLGFLTPLDVNNYRRIISDVIDGRGTLTLRSRLTCHINRAHPASTSSSTSNGSLAPDDFHRQISPDYRKHRSPSPTSPSALTGRQPLAGADSPPVCFRRSSSVITNSTQTSHMLVLNEVVIDRGQSAYLSNLEIYCNGRQITDVQGDGLIVATPTGSTAYAAAAGASMVHPSVQAMVVTPICPHSLSFRPIMVPGGVKIEVKVPLDGRGTGAVSCDGKNRQELARGDSVSISMSIYPLPCIDGADHVSDWFTSLSSCLHWNARTKQKQLDAEEDEHDHVHTIPEE